MRRGWLLPTIAVLGFAFLYGPIVSLVVFSFNESRLVTVWSRFSLKWYGELFADPQMLNAAWLSLQIAAMSASIALVLGTLCAVALVRFRRFRGRTALAGMVSAPLVMPDVITGLSLLLLFVAMEGLIGWPSGRGATTITIAHTTFCMAYITVVVQSRLADLDLSLEEAAMDLGATPARVFFDITLPIIAPALISGWLLGFTLSLDDLVIASFVSGPGSSTLPMVIFSKIRLGVSPDVNALATIIIGIVSLGVLGATILQMTRPKTNKA
ncbi:ABC transporter permease subunit [Paradevosia shaoguanensis]|uniref:ABC transporter permease subunit n=1 Tax=Paradevosia shaoguanensis TaxID=1335043 RepID=UPI000455CB01|nr:spermidine/putrescine ABC transporter permease [Devosia sp. 17-2-E-8]CDP53734.1 Putrescine transport system permease protein PotI [Devosia sp. DBB001]